jgi:hypothetical protein
MTSKTQLQSKIQKLEKVGDVFEDGSIVLQKENGLALLVAPKSTEVEATWSKEFPEVFEKLKSQGFNPSQWFVPTVEQLRLAYMIIPNKFSSTFYWSSDTGACYAYFSGGNTVYSSKSATTCVRAFRCVTY